MGIRSLIGDRAFYRRLFTVMLPILTQNLITNFVNLLDNVMVGQVGTEPMSGVAIVNQLLFVFNLCVFGGLAGAGIFTAQFYGKNDNRGVADTFRGKLYIALGVLAVAFTVLIGFGEELILSFIHEGQENLDMAATLTYGKDYLRVMLLQLVPFAVMQIYASTLRETGETLLPMKAGIVAVLVNLTGNYILIFGKLGAPALGVVGAAIATVLSQAVSAVWILRFLTGKKTMLKLRFGNMILEPGVILPCLGLGVSSFVMVSTESILSVSFTSSLFRYGGDVAVGAMTVLTSVNQVISMPLVGICQGGQPLMSYNYGAGKLDRVKEAFLCQFTVCVSYATVFWVLVQLFPSFFAGIFTNEQALVDYTAWAMRIFLAGCFSVGFQNSCQQAFVALGQAKISLFMACLRKLILLIPLIFILPNFFQNKAMAVFLAEPVSDILAAAAATTAFFLFFRRLMKTGKAE